MKYGQSSERLAILTLMTQIRVLNHFDSFGVYWVEFDSYMSEKKFKTMGTPDFNITCNIALTRTVIVHAEI